VPTLKEEGPSRDERRKEVDVVDGGEERLKTIAQKRLFGELSSPHIELTSARDGDSSVTLSNLIYDFPICIGSRLQSFPARSDLASAGLTPGQKGPLEEGTATARPLPIFRRSHPTLGMQMNFRESISRFDPPRASPPKNVYTRTKTHTSNASRSSDFARRLRRWLRPSEAAAAAKRCTLSTRPGGDQPCCGDSRGLRMWRAGERPW